MALYSIVDGRYKAGQPTRNVGPPIEIYHEAFSHFSDAIRNSEIIPDDDITRKTVKYMLAASAIYPDERSRAAKLTPLLEKILGVNIQMIVNDDKTYADGIVELVIDGARILLLVKEDKNENGDGGCDPSTQSGLSGVRNWVQTKVSECIVHHVLLRSFTPSLRSTGMLPAAPRFFWRRQVPGS